MQLRQLTLREIHLKLLHPFETSMDRVTERRIILAEAEVDGIIGWGECTAGENPFYSPEDTETCWHILTQYLWPTLKGKQFASASDIWPLLEHVRGHNMAKATIETAIWDAEAKQKNLPLWKLLNGARTEIPCGVSIGIKDTIEDANSAYRKEDLGLLKQLDAFYLMMIEQPLGWDDLFGHVEIQKAIQTPICLDECIHTYEQAEAAAALGACKIINIKLGRVGGHHEARRVHDLCQSKSIPVWCGGMLESGIGRAQNIAMSTLPNFSLPGDVSASKRYWHQDIIDPEVTVTSQGTIQVPTAPGIGFEPRRDFIDSITTRKLHLT
jgi:O-succinylbenzoate synthase